MKITENISPLSSQLGILAEFRYALRLFLSFSEKASEQEGVSAQQYQLLQVIAAAPNGTNASVGFIAERMILRHNSAVELVDRAVRSGLVKREIDPEDLRRSLVVMTPKGEDVLARLARMHLAELEAHGHTIARSVELLLGQKQTRAGRQAKE